MNLLDIFRENAPDDDDDDDDDNEDEDEEEDDDDDMEDIEDEEEDDEEDENDANMMASEDDVPMDMSSEEVRYLSRNDSEKIKST